jgi:hypothetical protein
MTGFSERKCRRTPDHRLMQSPAPQFVGLIDASNYGCVGESELNLSIQPLWEHINVCPVLMVGSGA